MRRMSNAKSKQYMKDEWTSSLGLINYTLNLEIVPGKHRMKAEEFYILSCEEGRGRKNGEPRGFKLT